MPEQRTIAIDDLKIRLRRELQRPVRRGEERHSHLKLRQLEVFREAANQRSFSAAAKRLGVSRAYVSEAITKLEQDLGDQIILFDRDTGGAELTPAGYILTKRAERLLSAETEAITALGGAAQDKPRGAPNAPHAENHHLKLRQLEILVEASQHRNLSSAARALGISTAYASEAIASLEHALGGVRLFERDTEGSTITQAGRLLAARGRQLLVDEEATVDAVASASNGQTLDGSVSARHHQNVRDILAAVEFIGEHAPPGNGLRVSATLAESLTNILPELGPRGAAVERVVLILDVMQASVTHDDGLKAMLEASGRASEVFRQHHAASEQRQAEEAKRTATHRSRRSR
jgi:DNA-binding transcriptional LysR family regulator